MDLTRARLWERQFGQNVIYSCPQCQNSYSPFDLGLDIQGGMCCSDCNAISGISLAHRRSSYNSVHGRALNYECPFFDRCGNLINLFNNEICHNDARSKGGSNKLSNLFLACGPCNKAMATKTIDEYHEKVDYEDWMYGQLRGMVVMKKFDHGIAWGDIEKLEFLKNQCRVRYDDNYVENIPLAEILDDVVEGSLWIRERETARARINIFYKGEMAGSEVVV